MERHVHGGDIYRYPDTIDFSSNSNPLGTPAGVKEAVKKSAEHLAWYPQVGYQTLKEAIGAYEAVPASQVICGNGAAELIYLLCRAKKPKKALLPAPTFAEYAQALQSVGCAVDYYFLSKERGFSLDEGFLEVLDEEIDLLFLCNPNNPTGVLTSRDFLEKLLALCREKKIFLAVDECFLDFVRRPGDFTMKPYLSACESLFLLKAFTKRYAMAGVRLGYGLCANESLLMEMSLATQPWNLSVTAQEAGLAALKEEEYLKKGRQMVLEQQAYLIHSLQSMGFPVYGSQANYIFFQGPDTLWEDCLKEGLLLRDCGNYPGLAKGYYRAAVRTPAENETLVDALQKIRRNAKWQKPL